MTLLRKKDYMSLALCVALGVAILIIIYLLYDKSNRPTKEKTRRPPPEPVSPPPTGVPPQKPPAIVKFYADWCGACKAMAPEWERAKPVMAKMVQVIEIEGNKHPNEIKQNGIAGFPTIRLYPEGFPSEKYIEYKGNRSSNSLIKFVSSRGQEN